MNSFNKILVIQTAFIGDAILASAALESIHKQFPNTELHIIVRKGNEALYEQHPYLKKVWVWDKKENKIKNLFKIISGIRKEKFDWLINLHRFASSGLITVLSKAKVTCGFILCDFILNFMLIFKSGLKLNFLKQQKKKKFNFSNRN